MLPKENRLTRKEDFARVYEKGYYFCHGTVAIKFLKNEAGTLKIGLSVGKNFSKLATVRNRARRIIRETMRKQLSGMKTGFDIIIIGKKYPGKAALSSGLENDLNVIFSKTNLYK